MAGDGVRLLEPDEPPAARTTRAGGQSRFFLTCDHAGRRIPRRLGTLGLGDSELQRHIAWDIGALGVAERLSVLLDAPLVEQSYSRLVIDCNRNPSRHDSIAPVSERTEIPGNRDLPDGQVEARRREVFQPYHDAIADGLDRRPGALLVCVHSFTPVYKDVGRPWHIGLLYNRDRRMADLLHEVIAEDAGLCVGDNEPYAVSDDSDYTVPVHGEQRGIPHIEVEIRQDLVTDTAGQRDWAARLHRWLLRVEERLGSGQDPG